MVIIAIEQVISESEKQVGSPSRPRVVEHTASESLNQQPDRQSVSPLPTGNQVRTGSTSPVSCIDPALANSRDTPHQVETEPGTVKALLRTYSNTHINSLCNAMSCDVN